MKTILIADKDRAFRSYAAQTLARAGFGVIEAADAEETLLAAGVMRPDAILIGRSVPGLPREQALRRIRALPGRSRTPLRVLDGALTAAALITLVRDLLG